MGNIVQKKDTSIETPTMKALTEQQIQIIKTTWEIPNAKPIDSGELILYRYFEKYPENQEKFLAFKNTPLLMLRGSEYFYSNFNVSKSKNFKHFCLSKHPVLDHTGQK